MTHAWKDKIGNVSQIGGIETAVLDNGPARGSRIAWINTGGGLRYKVAIDRCLDIVDASYNQYNLAWLSHGGLTIPRHDANNAKDWLYSFAGGLVTTCGLTHIGGMESDEKETRGLHGRISNIPATVGSIVQPDPSSGQMDMSITAVVKESKVYGPHLELKRTIKSTLGEKVIEIIDEVTNKGNTPCPHMILYHCNFGWPLVDEDVDIIYVGHYQSLEGEIKRFVDKSNYPKCRSPIEEHKGEGYICNSIDVQPDKEGICHVGFVNKKLGLALTMKYQKQQLPALTNWQHWGPGEYVCALEPGTNPPIGQNKARKLNELIILEPGEKRNYRLELSVISDSESINDFIAMAG